MFNSVTSKVLSKCIACGVTIIVFLAEISPSIYGAYCKNCHEHTGHLSRHTHQEQPLPFYVGGGLQHVAISTIATARILRGPVL